MGELSTTGGREDAHTNPGSTDTPAGTERSAKEDDQELTRRLSRITHKVLVLSGKGGVGKSSVASCLAVDLAGKGKRVGLLDIDIHGPSIPRMLDVEGDRVTGTGDSLVPVRSRSGVLVMSIGLLLGGSDAPVIWRGPLKYNVIRQFLRDVEWGDLDYLIVDSPPGTGDEPLSVAQLIEGADGSLIVTTPQTVSTNDVRRSIGFSRQLDLPVLGVIENMSGFVCPECGAHTDVFGSGGGEAMSKELGCNFLGRIPIDPAMVTACDTGLLHTFLSGKSPGALAFKDAAENLVGAVETASPRKARSTPAATTNKRSVEMDSATDAAHRGRKIAIPVTGGKLAEHFGHCETFEIFAVGDSPESIKKLDALEAPPHQPGLLPEWLNGHGVDIVIAGGMGSRAKDLFQQGGIEVVVGAIGDPAEIVRSFVAGTLTTGANVCDH